MTFDEFLISKKIDSQAFQRAQPAVWQQWGREFDQLHPNSFTAQKLFSINKIRRQFPLTTAPEAVPAPAAPAKPKPIIRPKIN